MNEQPYASHYHADRSTLYVEGVVDHFVMPEFRHDVDQAVAAATAPLVVDLSRADLLCAGAVTELVNVRADQQQRGLDLHIHAVDGTIHARVLTLMAVPFTLLVRA